MCYSPSPPPSSNAIFPSYLTFGNKCSSDHINFYNTTSFHCQVDNSNYIASTEEQHNMQRTEDIKNVNDSKTDEETASDYKQWLHAMKLVARLPGGIPPEFRRKLWLSLADKYLKSKNVDWATEEEKCFREKWREDDEELGIQIVKDLHRTGSTLCTGPAGDLNQAKLKRILLGYARYNTEVGYCQGFNMLGALILQVMDKDESESIKVMIYLVEGILPPGYFCGSMGGLQADMAVFRELMQTKLPRLAKHLQKLQGPIENAYEPPLTNVFTMQWFLTMFCTCLPMSCVLRVWDLVLIEGSDVLLRTALVLWSLLEERVLSTRSADDFYGKMGSFSSELLNGHLIDSNGLIEKVVQLGPITDIQKLREKHLCSVAPIGRQQGLQIYFDDDEPDMDEDSRLAVATVWGIPWVRRGSHGQQNNNNAKQTVENKDRIALDISLLKKQYDKLRERQKQAQIILTTACSSAARQSTTTTPLPVNQLLSGRPAIVTNKGRRSGPPTGAIPPARKPSLPAVLHDKPFEKQLKRGETLLWRDTRDAKNRRDSLSWKEIKAERAALISSGSIDGLKSQKIRSGRLGKSDSSSYSEESDDNDVKVAEDASSSDTSLDEDELQAASNAKEQIPNIGNSHKLTHKALRKSKKSFVKQRNQSIIAKNSDEKIRPKSWAPSNSEIPFVLMTADSPNHSADENPDNTKPEAKLDISKWENPIFSSNPDDKDVLEIEPTEHEKVESPPATEVLSPGLTRPLEEVNKNENIETFDISSEGVTNEYFERINSTERPTKLDLFYSLNEDEPIRATYKAEDAEFMKSKEEPRFYANGNSSSLNNNIRCMDLLVDYSEKSSAACIEEAKSEISVFKNENGLRKIKTSAEKRRDPRRLTLTRSSTMDIEKRFESFEKRFSMELCTNYTKFSDGEAEFNVDSNKRPHQGCVMNFKQTNNIRDPNYNTSAHEALSMGSNNYPDKKIPSTADLEERFENIQQQLVRDRNRMNKSPCDSDNTEEQSTSKTSPESNIRSSSQKGKTDEQPQKPDEVEEGDRTEGEAVLSRQSEKEEKSSPSKESEDVSKSSGTKDTQNDTAEDSASTTSKTKLVQRKKEPPDENTEEDNIQRDSLSRKKSAESEEKTTTSQKPSPGSEEDAKRTTQKTSETVGETTGKSPITAKKPSERSSPPSTEELEKRFSALTEQMKSEKNETKAATREVSPKKEKRSTVEVVDEGSHACTENLSKSEKDCDKIEDDISNNLTSADPKDFPTKSEFRTEKTTHRRLSEPPSTEDLERRYEVLKRRMSSRYFETKTLHKESVSSELKHTDRRVDNEDYSQISSSKKSPPSIENLEERFEKLQTKSEPKSTNSTQSPPSTENLEERFEKLQNKPDPKDAKKPQSTTADESQDDRTDNQIIERKKSNTTEPDFVSPTEKEVEVPGETGSDEVKDDINRQESRSASAENYPAQNDMKNSKNKVEASDDNMNSETPSKMFQKKVGEISEKKKTLDLLSKNANKIKIKLIEELQAKIKEHSKDADESLEKKNAVIEELKTKIKPLPDEFLKPTSISSRRRPQSQNTLLQSLSFNDETLESHATSANRKLGKHEPSSTANRKMVRRFSDLPSRADLENRLQFLEEQLSKTVCMQRRASDSEVASRAHLQSRSPVPDSLEFRVQELEKRLKDNRTISMDVECSSANEKNEPDIEISQVELATNSAAVTGKELVRYSSHGEMSDMERQNPINISINIQMTINKEEIGMKKNTEDSKADDLDKRLQILEQRLKTSLTVGEKTADREKDMKLKDLADEEEKVNNQVAGDASAKDVTVQNGLTSEDFDHSSSSNKADEHTTNDKLSETDSSGVAENSGNIKEETKGTDANKTSGEIEEEVQVIEENKKIESTEPEQTEIQKNSQEQKLKENKEEKGIKDDIPKCITKKTEKVEVLKSDGEPTTTKSVESNTKEDKNIINALQQKPQSQTDEVIDPREVVAVKETPMPQENKTAEPKSFEPDEIETIKVVESSEAKTSSEIEKCIGLNKGSQIVPVEVNKKTLVLLLDNEPKAVKVRRLTRANTEELEGLFQALEKQLNDRGLHKSLKTDSEEKSQIETEACKAMLDLAKEIEQFSKNEPIKSEEKEKPTQTKETKPEEEFDWGSDPIKRHLKRRTVHLPSTKELEARFRSLERQIKLFEDVEKINVEHRLTEIERKIKLQYSLSHEKDLNKFLELCEGKDPDEVLGLENPQERRDYCEDHKQSARNPSPNRLKEQSCNIKQYYHPPDLKRTKSKQSLKKQPIHPLEMLLDPSPDERDIPTTGELEHRIRVMNETHYSPSPPSRKSRSQSPPLKQNQAKSNIHFLEQMTASPEERELPTAEQLEARLEALEREQSFNFKMQKDFQQFNQKLKDVVSPSLSFDEFKSTKTSESAQIKEQVSSIAKQTKNVRAISPKTIHFYGEESPKKRVESKKPFSEGGESQQLSASREGLGVMGNRLMRETSPLRRKGTHTGVPLRTGENINDQLTSIQNTIKSIDSLCEEKPYRKERCQQYIDSLCSDSTYFAHKKASLEDLTSRNLSRSTSREIGPSIKVSDHSPVFSRSMGSADSIRSSSPLRPTSPLQYRSNRDLRREPSPRRRREEDREEHESRDQYSGDDPYICSALYQN